MAEAGRGKGRRRLVKAVCRCRREQIVALGNLRQGLSTQCRSCAKKGRPSNRRTHGEAFKKSAEYNVWRRLRQRCYAEYDANFKHYGGRGITVCKRWQGPQGYVNFLADMGRRPERGYSIERINNNSGYYPSNCKWALQKEQNRNKRGNVRVRVGSEVKTIAGWAEFAGLKYHTLWARLRRAGWSSKLAISTKPRRGDRASVRQRARLLARDATGVAASLSTK
jgi:hypothetical protein